MTLFSPCISAVGPKTAKIAIVGEAPGEQEELTGIPFIGNSGQELDRMLLQAGLARSDCYLTNVLFTRPPKNKMEAFSVKRAELPAGYNLPAMSAGKYLHPDLVCELDRLQRELLEVQPNLIIAAGGTAAWALIGDGRISKVRGAIASSPYGKVLPTFHPAFIYQNWSIRPIIVADLKKAAFEQHFPEIRRPQRFILVDPTLEEALAWLESALYASMVAVDSETKSGTITLLGFAKSKSEGLVIPFFDPRRRNSDERTGHVAGSYWTARDEVLVRQAINRLLASDVPKILQNGVYDVQYFLREGYRLRNIEHDTMILQHALYPEMPKSLGFLGSIHCNDLAWKELRNREDETLKKED